MLVDKRLQCTGNDFLYFSRIITGNKRIRAYAQEGGRISEGDGPVATSAERATRKGDLTVLTAGERREIELGQ